MVESVTNLSMMEGNSSIKLFNALTSLNISDLLEAMRREKAISLLKDSQLNLPDIAQQLGYANSANFSRAFKRWTNMSPRYFRQQHIS